VAVRQSTLTPMWRLAPTGALVGVLVVAIAPVVAQEITAQAVQQAIQKGVAFLRNQARNGTWADYQGFPGGVSALATLALLNSGVEPTDPLIQQALAKIRMLPPSYTYVVSLQTMALCRAQPEQDLLTIRRNVRWLEAKQITEGPNKGGWSYPTGTGDNSNSQFALLALFEAEQVGVEVNAQTWRLAKAYWEAGQNADGSWGYQRQSPGTGSMTSAGIASMVIAEDRVGALDARIEGKQIRCCERDASTGDSIVRALQWMDRHFSITSNPGSFRLLWHYYYLYGVERVGRMTAHRFIGGHDWYREGADFLVSRQDPLSGYWRGPTSTPLGMSPDDPVIATPLALLFLSKGRRPVIVAKLRHGVGDDWNQHRNDVGNLVRYVESRWKRELTWQVVDLNKSSIDDLVQTPVLYLTGQASPLPTAPTEQQALVAKLRGYLDRGGFLLAEGSCSNSGFDAGFRRLMELVFPEPEYRLRLLPPEHPVWFAEEEVDPDQERPLLGIDFGCRTSVIFAPGDPQNPRPSLSCLWELSRRGRGQEASRTVEAQLKAGLSIGVNLLAYATNREVRSKEFFFRTAPDKLASDPVSRGRVRVACVRHPGGCTAAPRALTNLLEATARESNLRIDATDHQVTLHDEALFRYHMLFMHGRTRFRLTDLERRQLKTYLERGGLLFVDSICASREFADAMRKELAAIFPDRPLVRIPPKDPLFTPAFGGFDLSTVTRRLPELRDPKEPLKAALRPGPPMLEGIRLGDRWGVIFSPLDLSCALERQDSMECAGYVRDDAARIGVNVVLYSLYE
jgi:hypothetical protein